MSSLSPTLSDERAVLLCGISGSGKTELSRQLERAGFTRLGADDTAWRIHGPGLENLPFEEQRQVFDRAHGEIAAEMRRILAGGGRVVVDATMCKRAKRESMRAVCASVGVEPLIVYLSAPERLLMSRLAGRRGTGHNDQIITPGQLAGFCRGFEPPQPGERFITIEQTPDGPESASTV